MNFDEYMAATSAEKISYFLSTLASTNRTPEFFLSKRYRDKTYKVITPEDRLLFDTLIGVDNPEEHLLSLFTAHPHLMSYISHILGFPNNEKDKTSIEMRVTEANIPVFVHFDFVNPKAEMAHEYVELLTRSLPFDRVLERGSEELQNLIIAYDVGLETNTRKNESGKIMELKLKSILNDFVLNHPEFQYGEQKTSSQILVETEGIIVPVKSSNKKYDAYLFNTESRKLWLLETNYYQTSGSKIKSIAAEYCSLNGHLEVTKASGDFEGFQGLIWLSDGIGWHKLKSTLNDTMQGSEHSDNADGKRMGTVFNLSMIQDGYLEKLTSDS